MANVSTFGSAIVGISQFQRELRAIDSKLPKELQKANKAFAQRLVPSVRSAYSRHYPKPTPKVRRRTRRSRVRTIDGIRAVARQTSAGIAIGGARRPHMLGQEFGSDRYPQFAPWTVGEGRFLYPTVGEEAPKLVAEYGKVLMDVSRQAFPDRGL
jgi:hypothetical protein